MKIKIGKREPIEVGPDTMVELIENGITIQIKADTVFLALYRGLAMEMELRGLHKFYEVVGNVFETPKLLQGGK